MNAQRGYSLAELMTVVAIIGVLSLVSIPSFVSYSRSLKIRSATRQFNSDLRAARARAITKSNPVAVSFAPGANPTFARRGEYRIYDQRMDTSVDPPQIVWDLVGQKRFLDRAVYFQDSLFEVDQAVDDELHDIVFLPNGTIQEMPSGAVVVIKSEHDVTNNTVTDVFTSSGSFKTRLTTDYTN